MAKSHVHAEWKPGGHHRFTCCDHERIADAIPNGVGAKIDMPATSEKIWRACRKAQT